VGFEIKHAGVRVERVAITHKQYHKNHTRFPASFGEGIVYHNKMGLRMK
jgi:hypothetical protein